MVSDGPTGVRAGPDLRPAQSFGVSQPTADFIGGSADLVSPGAMVNKLKALDTASDLTRLAQKVDNVVPDVIVRSPIEFVDETASMSPRARVFDSGATGSRSNINTRNPQAPQIQRTLPDGTTRPVHLDGVDRNIVIDRKLSVVTSPKAKNQAIRQSQALRQNGLLGRWEVPNESQAARARKMFKELGITNITVEVVDGP